MFVSLDPLARYLLYPAIHAWAGPFYGKMYNISPEECSWMFSISCLANNSIRVLAGVLMMVYLDKPQSFVRAKILLDVSTYSITILFFRQFGLIANKGTLASLAGATCLTIASNFKFFNPATADQAAEKFMDRIKCGYLEDLQSMIWWLPISWEGGVCAMCITQLCISTLDI